MAAPKYAIEYKLTATRNKVERVKISSSMASYEFAKKFYSDDIIIYESMFAIFLDRSNNTIGWMKISQGGVSGTVIDIKLLAKYSIDCLASSVILCHNHPSGNKQPSDGDKTITRKAKEALKLLDVTLLDHLIMTDEGYTSFADEGLI